MSEERALDVVQDVMRLAAAVGLMEAAHRNAMLALSGIATGQSVETMLRNARAQLYDAENLLDASCPIITRAPPGTAEPRPAPKRSKKKKTR